MIPLRSFLEQFWFALALSVVIITWALRTRRRVLGASQPVPRPRPPSGSVGPVPFRGADFAAKVAMVQRFHSKTIGAMIVFGFLSLVVFAVPGLPRVTRTAIAVAAAIGAALSWLVLAIRDGPLLRRLGLYCPRCGDPLVGGRRTRWLQKSWSAKRPMSLRRLGTGSGRSALRGRSGQDLPASSPNRPSTVALKRLVRALPNMRLKLTARVD